MAPSRESRHTDGEAPSRLPVYLAFGAAGVGGAATAFFAINAANAKADYDDMPTQEGFDDTKRFALAGDIAFGVTVACAVLGVGLLWTSSDDKEHASVMVAPIVGSDAVGGGAVALFLA